MIDRTPCLPPPDMPHPTPRKARVIAYIRAEVEAGRGIPSKRKIMMKLGKDAGDVKRLLAETFERSGLIRVRSSQP